VGRAGRRGGGGGKNARLWLEGKKKKERVDHLRKKHRKGQQGGLGQRNGVQKQDGQDLLGGIGSDRIISISVMPVRPHVEGGQHKNNTKKRDSH